MQSQPIGDWAVVAAATLSIMLLFLIIVVLRERHRNRVLRALLGSMGQPLLFYDARDRLVYSSPGIVLFDRQASKQIARPPERPVVGQTAMGEILIDFNRYCYQAKLMEYKPSPFGVLGRP